MKFIIVILGVLSTPLYGQDAATIVDHYLDTVSGGNIDNWNKLKTLYTESVGWYSQQHYEHKIDFSKVDKPSFTKSFHIYPYNRKSELYDDSTFTKLSSTFYFLENKIIILMSNMPPVIKSNVPRDEFASDHLPVQVWKLMNKRKSVELLGIKEFPLDGLSCYEIKINTRGRNYYLYINTNTFLLDYWSSNEHDDRAFMTKYYDYKNVEGFLMPMSEARMRDGIVFHSSRTTKIDINPDIDPEILNYKEQ